MGYEQMELDVTLSGERELKDNVSLAVEFACHQVAEQSQKTVESNRCACDKIGRTYRRE